MVIPEEYLDILDEMFMEFSESQLEVCLVPNRDPDKQDRCLRAVTSQNSDWYKEMCASFPANRSKKRYRALPDTRVKRHDIAKLFERMLKNRKTTSQYGYFILDEAKRRKDEYDRVADSYGEPWDNQF